LIDTGILIPSKFTTLLTFACKTFFPLKEFKNNNLVSFKEFNFTLEYTIEELLNEVNSVVSRTETPSKSL
jgi:hypothetical protein